ncbi:MAG: carotenoid oxygenase family protein [Acidimicrobiales bacterium]
MAATEVTEQTVERPLDTEGAVPPVLDGLLVRNGPTGYADGATGPDADGMVHALELRAGAAVGYRSRWVRTRRLAGVAGTTPARGPAQAVDGPANIHVVWHGGRLLALDGQGLPHLLSPRLDTVGVEDFDGMLTSPVSAHPHVDPATGVMAFTGTDVFGPPFLRYHELDAAGMLVHSTEVPLEQAVLHADLGVTASRVVLFDLPPVHDRGARPLPFSWDSADGDGRPARVGVLARGATGETVRWVPTEPCVVTHVANAFDDGDDVVADVVRHDGWTPDDPLAPPAVLERWRIGRRSVARTPVDDLSVELPRVDPALAGRPYRFVYCAADDGALVRYDLDRDERARWEPGGGRAAGEPLFVRDPDGHADDEGWVLALVDEGETTDLVVLDASSFGRRAPDAVVHLPARVRRSCHGSWAAGLHP